MEAVLLGLGGAGGADPAEEEHADEHVHNLLERAVVAAAVGPEEGHKPDQDCLLDHEQDLPVVALRKTNPNIFRNKEGR